MTRSEGCWIEMTQVYYTLLIIVTDFLKFNHGHCQSMIGMSHLFIIHFVKMVSFQDKLCRCIQMRKRHADVLDMR